MSCLPCSSKAARTTGSFCGDIVPACSGHSQRRGTAGHDCQHVTRLHSLMRVTDYSHPSPVLWRHMHVLGKTPGHSMPSKTETEY